MIQKTGLSLSTDKKRRRITAEQSVPTLALKSVHSLSPSDKNIRSADELKVCQSKLIFSRVSVAWTCSQSNSLSPEPDNQ